MIKKLIASSAVVMGVGAVVMGGMGMGSATAASAVPTVAQCTTSAQWVMGQQAHGHTHPYITKALRSNADALKAYPSCHTLSPQLLNVIVARDAKVKVLGPEIYTHWTKTK